MDKRRGPARASGEADVTDPQTETGTETGTDTGTGTDVDAGGAAGRVGPAHGWLQVDLSELGAPGTLPGWPGPPAADPPASAARRGDASEEPGEPEEPEELEIAGPGLVVAVWGPTGAPGRSVVAAALAAVLAEASATRTTTTATAGDHAPSHDGPRRDRGRVLLIDADPYGGAQAVLHGAWDEASGLLRAARLADRHRLDEPGLAGCLTPVSAGFDLVTGLADPAAWPRLRPEGLEAVLDAARAVAHWTIVDVGFCLEEDEELSYDTAAPRRNQATLAALRAADVVLAVAACDPVGQGRLRAQLPTLRALLGTPIPVLLNRVGAQGAPRAWAGELVEALEGDPAVERVHLLPDDPVAVRAQLAERVPLPVAAPGSVLASTLRGLLPTLALTPAAAARTHGGPGGRTRV